MGVYESAKPFPAIISISSCPKKQQPETNARDVGIKIFVVRFLKLYFFSLLILFKIQGENATIIELNDGIKDKNEIEKIILINVPAEIYPELRKIFIFIFESSGFKDIKISNNIDFQKLYNLRKIQ